MTIVFSELEIIRKTKGLGLSAISASHKVDQAIGTCALGFINGDVKIRQLDAEFKMLNHFKSSRCSESNVLQLDFNCTHENIASTHANGLISIYSLTTSVKYDSIKLDGTSILSRFHPSKRSLLGIASYEGNATLYDIFAKKSIFKNVGAE